MIDFKLSQDSVPDAGIKAVWALGNFDGMHLGHQMLLNAAKAIATSKKCSSGILTFSPLPQAFFVPKRAFIQLMSSAQKQAFVRKLGIDFYATLAFDKVMANWSPAHFIEYILCEQLKIRHLVVGFDFAFGKNRSGSIGDLEKYKNHFDLTVIEAKKNQAGQKISSSMIRQFIQEKDFKRAEEMLGRPLSLLL